MATNATKDSVVDDDDQVTEDDLRALKYDSSDVETLKGEDETDELGRDTESTEETGKEEETNSDAEAEETTDTEEESEESTVSEFVKEFPYIKGDTPEEYAKNLEAAYKNSTAEALRLKSLSESTQPKDKAEKEEVQVDTSDPIALYMKQKMDEEITTAYDDFKKSYSQVNDQTEYDKFTRTVSTLSNTILTSEGRMAPPKELYSKAAVILGWEAEGRVESKDRLDNALKDKAAVSKNPNAATKRLTRSKVTDKEVTVARLTWASKDMTDAKIREELEAHV